MSFILDALKKSESDRQRQSGPALYEVKVAPPRTGLPPWAIAVVALLAVNLVIGVWMLLRHPGTHAASEAAAAPATAAQTTPAAASAAGQTANVQIPAPAAAPAAAVTNTVSAPVPGTQIPPAAVGAPGADGGHADSLTPEDYAPAAETATSTLGGHVRRGTGTGVPLYQDAATTPGKAIPQLRLDLHAYAARPQDRFVMINMHKVHEGDMLPEGVHVESITPDGVVLSYNGSSFLLPRD
jgi:general secretion pathway protein B